MVMMERLIYIVVLCYCVSSVLITQSSAAAGADCTTNPTTVCVDASQEVCENNVCVCKSGFVNIDGTCTAFNCNGGTDTCKNDGTCPSTGTACTCVAGWVGDDCGRDINECQANPCLKCGSCTNSDGSYTCACVAGWSGTTCNTFDCNAGTCQNGGTCDTGETTCTCVSGYMGDDCGTAFDCNKGGTCANGGTCAAGNAACSCVAGYTGVDCGTDINDCLPNPCLNSATCNDIVNGYTCNCVAGWSGATCNTFNCHDGTCQNDGTCDSGETACTCVAGYTGDDCGTVPNKSAGKTAMTAVILMMAVLTHILIQMF